jgi:hypothetical protein
MTYPLLAFTLMIVAIVITILGLVLTYRDRAHIGTSNITLDLKNFYFNAPAPVGIFAIAGAILVGAIYAWSQTLSAENERLTAALKQAEGQSDNLSSKLTAEIGKKGKALAEKDAEKEEALAKKDQAIAKQDTIITALHAEALKTDGTISAQNDDALKLKTEITDLVRDRNRAQLVANSIGLISNAILQNEAERDRHDALNKDLRGLNADLYDVGVRDVYQPKILNKPAVAIYEIYRKTFDDPQSQPRGIGLFDFDSQKYLIRGDSKGKMLDYMGEIIPAVCGAAQLGITQKIPFIYALKTLPEIHSDDLDPSILRDLAEFTYIQMWFRLKAGDVWIETRGYADEAAHPFQVSLGNQPKVVAVHQQVETSDGLGEYSLTFQEQTANLSIGTAENGAVWYKNDDLPDLRANRVKDILGAIVDQCESPFTYSGPIKPNVGVLAGRVYPEYPWIPDRKVRVYILIFLKP